MSHRRSKLAITYRELAVNADIRTRKIPPEPVDERAAVNRGGGAFGSTAVRRAGDVATGNRPERRSGYRRADEAREEVPAADVDAPVPSDDETGVALEYEPTLGDGRTLEAIRWIPVAEVDEYLIDEIHEIRGDSDEDVAQLYRLAKHVRDVDQVPVVPVVLRPSCRRNWGIITPAFFDGTFSLLLRVASRKIEPEERMSTPDSEAVVDRDGDVENYETLDRGSSSG